MGMSSSSDLRKLEHGQQQMDERSADCNSNAQLPGALPSCKSSQETEL